jgi:hypothetical protein
VRLTLTEGNTYKNIYFPKHGHQKKCKNVQRPLFTPTVDLSQHVNKTPIHLVTLPLKEVRVTRRGTTTVDKKPNIFARLSLKFYIVHKHNQRPREYLSTHPIYAVHFYDFKYCVYVHRKPTNKFNLSSSAQNLRLTSMFSSLLARRQKNQKKCTFKNFV